MLHDYKVKQISKIIAAQQDTLTALLMEVMIDEASSEPC